MGQMDKGVSVMKVDEGCSRVMEDRAKWMEGKKETTERPTRQISSSRGQCQKAAEELSYL
jgi:hypothetical protein